MMSSSPRDNWERLVAAVVKRDQIWQLFHQDSISTATNSSHRPSNYSAEILSSSSNGSERISVSPPRQRPLTSASGLEVRKNASGPITWKLFSALQQRRKPKDDHSDGIPEDLQPHLRQVRSFSLHEVQFATDDFHNKNIIARGMQSKIYKGRLADGSLVAVKRLTAELQEIGTELKITSIAAHHNVLRVRGFCNTKKERLLIYPFMVNGSVASQLRERQESLPPLNWPVRKRIALGAAKGLAYLHYECLRKIIHRDIKAANVLLDEYFEAVVADFNLAEFMDCYDGDVVTGIKGTLGHIAPEYRATGKYSVKVDVFGYGVFLLELITAQKSYDLAHGANDDDVMLLNRVKGSYKERKWKMMIDADLQGDFVDEEVEKLLQIALICTQTDPGGRPTMLEVVRMLEVGYGLAERWEELYKDFKDENMELGHLRRFTIHELQAATEDFSNKIISKDGFNMVYKGLLAGSPVAIKSYNSRSLEYYFQKELDIGRNCFHPNIVHVIGFCNTTPEEQLLVFHLMVNGSVESWLRGRHESRPPLTWQKRKQIALGAARGLAYLHDKCGKKFIHRDIKAANILLDENFEAVVADFGVAKFMDRNQTHVTTTVRGTIGHIAPEYLVTGECSDKTDVYSYGVFLLELITGQTAFDLLRLFKFEDVMLIDWVKRNYELRKWEGMVDEDSGGNFMESAVKLLVQIALRCTRFAPDERPKMPEVVRMLEVGDGSAERPKEEVEKERILEVGDGSAERSKEEVEKEDGSPYSEWIIDDGDSDGGAWADELSGPR